MKRVVALLVVGLALSLITACMTPVGVERLDPQEVWLGVENGTPGAEGSQ